MMRAGETYVWDLPISRHSIPWRLPKGSSLFNVRTELICKEEMLQGIGCPGVGAPAGRQIASY
jgi:hypothetical protein